MAISPQEQPEIILDTSRIYSSLGIQESQLGTCESPRILSVLSSLLERIVLRNERAANSSTCRKKVTIFHGLRAPSISIHSYIMRVFKYARCSPSCFVLAYAYIDKLTHQLFGAPITCLNVHRLVITGVMVAAKFLDDGHYNNAYYAKIGGVSTLEMNRLEQEFLHSLGYNVHITVSCFESLCAFLEKDAAIGGAYKLERPLICAYSSSDEVEAHERSQKLQLKAFRSTYSGV